MAEVWTVYKFVNKLTSAGIIEAKDEKEATEIKVALNRLIAQPTR